MMTTELEALRQILKEMERLRTHAEILASDASSGWDVGNSSQHLPFAVAAVSVALDRLISAKHNEFRQIVAREKERLEGINENGNS